MIRTIVTTTPYPDLDGFACALAYVELLRAQGINANAALFGTPYIEATYLMDHYGFPYPSDGITMFDPIDRVVLVDESELKPMASTNLNPQQVVEIIDHRKNHDLELFPNANVQLELVGSAATLVAERFKQANVMPSRMSGTLLYGAIISNTLNFQANVTTDRDHVMAQWLHSLSHFPSTFARELFLAKSDFSGPKLRNTIANDSKWWAFEGHNIFIAQIEMIGVQDLVQTRSREILEELHHQKETFGIDFYFCSFIELDGGYTMFVADDPGTQKLLESVLNISFRENVAQRPGLIMRKEIIPLIKEALSKH